MAISRSAVEGTPSHSSLSEGCVCVAAPHPTCRHVSLWDMPVCSQRRWAHLIVPPTGVVSGPATEGTHEREETG